MIEGKIKREIKREALALGILSALVAAMLFANPAHAVTFEVNSTADKVDDGLGDGTCATAAFQAGTEPVCTLRAAIQEANATSGADEIVVPAGTYKLAITGINEDLSATGDLDIRDGVSIRGAGARQTIIDGGGIDRVLHMPTIGGAVNPFTVNVSGVKVTGGSVANTAGGGIAHLSRGSDLNLTESAVSGNVAGQAGGIHSGAEPGHGGKTTIDRSTISGNRSTSQGGGIQNQITLTLTNSTVSGNESNIGGGIISSGTLRATDSTIAFNTAQNNSGGIYASSGATLKNAIVSNNKSASASSNNCSDPVTSEGNNLENGTSCGFVGSGDKNANPKLGSLKNYGGPTNTHALLGGSPAIDAGATTGCPATDQRGAIRPQRGTCDIGAFELENTPVARNDSYRGAEDRILRVPARGVLRNDTDADGDPLTAGVVSGPGKGRLTLRPNGAFTYKPARNFNGTVRFVYRASDGRGGTDTATVTIRIKARPR